MLTNEAGVVYERFQALPRATSYLVSDWGRVFRKSYVTPQGRRYPAGFRKLVRDSRGYMRISIEDDHGHRRLRGVHQVVLLAFDGEANGLQCRHLDGNKENNRYQNLCYGTAEENMQDKFRHGTTGKGRKAPWKIGNRHCAKLTESEVTRIRNLSAAGQTGKSLAKQFRVGSSTISRIVRRACWKDVA